MVCLCLVANFVGSASKRGEMLMKAVDMLYDHGILVVALPLACVENSRYFTRAHFRSLLTALSLEVLEEHTTAKLHFIMARRVGELDSSRYIDQFPKALLHVGNKRNNFHIVL